MVQSVEEMVRIQNHPTDSTPRHITLLINPSSSSPNPKKDKQATKLRDIKAKVPQDEAEVPQDEAGHEESITKPPSNDSINQCEGELLLEEEDPELGKEENVKTYRFEKPQQSGEAKVDWKMIQTRVISPMIVLREPKRSEVPQETQPSSSKDKGKGKRGLNNEEKAKLFMELIEKGRKHFAALRAQEKRNSPPTKAQKRTQLSTYLKHMGPRKAKKRGKKVERIQQTCRKKMLRMKRAWKEQQKESSNESKSREELESEEVMEDNEVEVKEAFW
ncbi:hypothetical protein Tco_0849728 [Tanacetum coccineum]